MVAAADREDDERSWSWSCPSIQYRKELPQWCHRLWPRDNSGGFSVDPGRRRGWSGRRRGVAGWLLGARRAGQQGTRRAGLLAQWHPAPGAWRRGGPTRGVVRRRTGGVGRRRNPRGLDCILHSWLPAMCYVCWAWPPGGGWEAGLGI
jgi:hypothetical protein